MIKRLLIFAVLVNLSSCFNDSVHERLVGSHWPNLTLKTDVKPTGKVLNEHSFNNNEQWIFINIWATWCAPCRQEMPSIQVMSDIMKNEGLDVVLISVDTDANLVREFNLQYGIKLQSYFANAEEFEDLFNSPGYPVSYLLDPAGKIVKVFLGAEDWQSTERLTELRTLMKV